MSAPVKEERECNQCGECFPDTGDETCPICGSSDTHIIDADTGEELELA